MKISPARTAAFDILMKIEQDRAFSSVLLPLYEENLSDADARLCHELTLGVLRRQMFLDKIILLLTDGGKIDTAVRVALRIGLYQLEFLSKIPPHSAVNDSVALVQRAKKTSAKSYVNAVLRRFTRDRTLSATSDPEKLSIVTSHPQWLIDKWVHDWGYEMAAGISEANNIQPQTAYRIIEDTIETAELSLSSKRSKHVAGAWVTNRSSPLLKKLAAEGAVYIQDEGSQVVGGLIDIPAKGRFLDVCAAPGGKTGIIARNFHRNANLVAAGDLHRQRVEHLRDNCHRQIPEIVSVLQYDAEKGLPFCDRSFDAVLVDAPCSGTGTIRHNPELRYFLKLDALYELQHKQLAILENASKLLVNCGVLTYSTCSLEPEENEAVASQFLSRNDGFRQVVPEISEQLLTKEGFLRTWPHRDGMDGFFVAQFIRTR